MEISQALARGFITIRKLRKLMEACDEDDDRLDMLQFSQQEMKACGVKRKRDETSLRQVIELDDALSSMLTNPKYIGVGAIKAASQNVQNAGVDFDDDEKEDDENERPEKENSDDDVADGNDSDKNGSSSSSDDNESSDSEEESIDGEESDFEEESSSSDSDD